MRHYKKIDAVYVFCIAMQLRKTGILQNSLLFFRYFVELFLDHRYHKSSLHIAVKERSSPFVDSHKFPWDSCFISMK